MDQYGDHALCCAYGSTRGWRHDSQTRLFAADLSKAARHPVLEPPQPGHAVRPDIKALGENGGTDYYDVTVIHPLTPARHPFLARCPLKPLNHARLGKDTRFAELIRSKGPGHRFIAVPLSTLGGWRPSARDFANRVATGIAARAAVPIADAQRTLFARHAARLIQNNASCLLEGVLSET